MKVYVQSKTGNYNASVDVLCPENTKATEDFLKAVLRGFRADGGYTITSRSGEILMIPFEEIEYIKEESGEIV